MRAPLVTVLLLLAAARSAAAETLVGIRLLPFSLPSGCERAAYVDAAGILRETELRRNHTGTRLRLAHAPEIRLFFPPDEALLARLRREQGLPEGAKPKVGPDRLRVLASIRCPQAGPRMMAVLFGGEPPGPPLIGVAAPDDAGAFPAGSYRIYNLTPHELGGQVDGRSLRIGPLAAGQLAVGPGRDFPARLDYANRLGERLPLLEATWRIEADERRVLFVWEDPAAGRMRFQGMSERLPDAEEAEEPRTNPRR